MAAVVGFVLAALEHLAAIIGDDFLSPGQRTVLFVGIAIVAVPVAFASKSLMGTEKQHSRAKIELRAAPPWMKQGIYVLVAYALVNMVVLGHLLSPSTFSSKEKQEDPHAPTSVRTNTAHAMAFYWSAFAILYSALHVRDYDRRRRCGNGHLIPPLAEVCEVCGAPVMVVEQINGA